MAGNKYNHQGKIEKEYLKNCKCVCDKNYISVWKTKEPYMEKDYGLNESELYYLFKFTEK